MKKHSFFRRVALLCCALLFSFLASACDDDGTEAVVNAPGTNTFIGTYLGANRVTAGQTGVLSLTVNAAGTAAGTLQVNAVMPQTVAPIGTYGVNGIVDLNTGGFTLNGNIPPLGGFTIAGSLANGTYTFTFNGQMFPGAIQPSSQGVPNVPGGGGGEVGQLISGGSLTNFMFMGTNGYNGDDPPVDAMSIISGAFGPGQNNESTLTIVLSETTLVNQMADVVSLAITVVDPSGDPIEAGDVFPLSMNDQDAGSVIALSRSVGTDVVEGWSLVQGTTGEVEIVEVTDTSITIDFTFSGVGPNSEIVNNPAMGTFSTSGRLTGNFVAFP